MSSDAKYPCPSCGHLVFSGPPGSYSACPVCFWEDDATQLRWPTYSGGANHVTLVEAQTNFARFRSSEERFIGKVRDPLADEPVEASWRPIDPTTDNFEPAKTQERPWPQDKTRLYWWRPSFWRRRESEPASMSPDLDRNC